MIRVGFDGILCQLLLYTSALFNTTNRVTLEFTTPNNVAPTSMLMCFNDTAMQLDASTFKVISLLEGGDLFTLNEQSVVNSSFANWTDAPFFSKGSYHGQGGQAPAEFNNLRRILSRDAYFASKLSHQRLDEFKQDWQGERITGLLSFPSLPANSSAPSSSPQNCVLLTGAWQAATRYELTIQVMNPLPATYDLQQPMPALWIAPVTTTSVIKYTSSGYVVSDVALLIRGSKYGTVCKIRKEAVHVLGKLWDPCRVLPLFSPSTYPDFTNKTGCLGMLAAMGRPPTAFPFNQPPLAAYSLYSFPSLLCLDPHEVFSTRRGGMCVHCGSGRKVGAAQPCLCRTSSAAALVGPVMCSPAYFTNGSITAKAELAQSLCAAYSGGQLRWQQFARSAKVGARLVLKSFMKAADSLLDWADLAQANATFYAQYVRDDRHPDSPTRSKTGIRPQCNKCDGPTFKNVNAGKAVERLFDYNFDAMNVLRLIGYMLDLYAGFPCPALWDKNEPMKWKYPFYEDIMCQALPQAKS